MTNRPRRGDIVSHFNENTSTLHLYRFGTDPEVDRLASKHPFYLTWSLFDVGNDVPRYVQDVGDAVAWVLGE